jgi:hypothetical protein
MTFLLAAAIGLSLLATPAGELHKCACGKGTVEKDGECVIPKPPKPKDCGKIFLTARGIARYTLVKATRKEGLCAVTLKAKSFDKYHFIIPSQYDKDGVKLDQGLSSLGELNAGESATMEFILKKGATKIKLHPQ